MGRRSSAPLVLAAAMEAVTTRVRADLGPDLLPGFGLRLDPAFSGTTVSGPEVVVGVAGARRFAAGFEHGLEIACATVMSALQDEAIDEIGRPWPELADECGRSVGVLDVVVEPPGVASWNIGDEVVSVVGLLAASCRARGWHIR